MANNIPNFDEDILSIMYLRNKIKNSGYNEFINSYKKFLDAAGIKNEIRYESPSSLVNFMNKETSHINKILNFLKDTNYEFNYIKLSEEFDGYILQLKVNSDLVKINDYNDFIKLNKAILNTFNLNLRELWLYAVKLRIYIFASNIVKTKAYLDMAFVLFKEYTDLKVKRLPIKESLMLDMISVMSDSHYDVSFYGKKRDEAYSKYAIEFSNYVKKYNENLKKPNIIKIESKPCEKEVKVQNINCTEENKEEKMLIKELEKALEQEEISKWVNSYLPGLCNLNYLPKDLSQILPQPYLKNYDQIIIELLKGYEKYISDKESSTMVDFHIYQELQIIVESLKK